MSQVSAWGPADRRVVLALLLVGVLVILAIGRDFGRSWDEADTAVYAQQTLDAYRGKPLEAGQGLSLYGPFAIVVSELVARGISSWLPGWSMIEARHASYFLGFVAGAICIYVLARGYVGVGASLAGALLFATQPLLLGHAFINPKDMPFLGFFALAMTVGFLAARKFPQGGVAWRTTVPPIERRTTWRGPLIWLLAAGLLAGAATSVRVVGPLAAILVSILVLYRLRGDAPVPLATYWSAMPVAAVATWPLLWKTPLVSFWEALRRMGSFPWFELVLFEGRQVPAQNLPWTYAPTHFALQVTLPALVLGLVGGVIALARAGPGLARAEGILLWAWLLAPVGSAIALGSAFYDGARQLLFVLPPLFVMAAIALGRLFDAVRWPARGLALGGLAMVPGLAAISALHPYEYIYFNELAGGVAGASGRFELDYWGTSYREIMLAMAVIAPPGATVGVAGPLEAAQPYARADLVLIGNEVEIPNAPDFQVVLNRWDFASDLWPQAQEVYRVEREGAVLSVVRDLRGLHDTRD